MPRRVSSSAALRADHPRWLFKDAALLPLERKPPRRTPQALADASASLVRRLISCRSFSARAALARLAGLARNRVIRVQTRLGSGRCGLQGLPAREKAVGGQWCRERCVPRFAERALRNIFAGVVRITPP